MNRRTMLQQLRYERDIAKQFAELRELPRYVDPALIDRPIQPEPEPLWLEIAVICLLIPVVLLALLVALPN